MIFYLEFKKLYSIYLEFYEKIFIQFQTTVSWGIKSTSWALLSQSALASFSSVESGELFVILDETKYFPVACTTFSDTAQKIDVCAPS